ncbi:Helicase associated domain protein [Clostridium sp.]
MSQYKPKKNHWATYYALSKEYFETYGNLNFDINYTVNELHVGKWITEQRKLHKGNKLLQERINALERIGIIWNGNNVRRQKREDHWNEIYVFARKFYEQNGHLLIPRDYEIMGVKLGNWVINLRTTYNGKNRRSISKYQIDKLNAIVMVWDKYEYNWDIFYEYARKYFLKNGNINVPQEYVFEEKNLGSWIHTQRQVYKGNKGKFTPEQIEKLNSIQMVWNPQEESWERYYHLATKYYELIGNLNIPDDYEMEGYNLGRWISVQRQAYNGRKDIKLTSEQIDRLNSIEMLWNGKNGAQTSFFEQTIYYYCRKCFIDTANNFKDNGFEIDIYIPSLKIGIEYDGSYWHKKKYIEDNVKDTRCHDLGIKLIRVREYPLEKTTSAINYLLQNDNYNTFSNLLSQIFIEQFGVSIDIDIKRDSIEILECFKTSASDPWYINFELARDYYRTYENLFIRRDYITTKGVRLGKWINIQRQAYKGNIRMFLTQEQIDKLNEIGMIWDKNKYDWDVSYEYAKKYFLENGDINVPQSYAVDNFKLGKWINLQRNEYNGKKSTSISNERIRRLNEIGMVWYLGKYKWFTNYLLAKRYFKEYGNLLIPNDYEIDGIKLGEWIKKQREIYSSHKKELTKERIALLNETGMVWCIISIIL